MADATRPPSAESAEIARRILRLVEEWEAITDPIDRRLLLEELGYERIERKATRVSAASRRAGGVLDGARRGHHDAHYQVRRPSRSEGLGL